MYLVKVLLKSESLGWWNGLSNKSASLVSVRPFVQNPVLPKKVKMWKHFQTSKKLRNHHL
jgi:hypothetical protein